MVRVFMAYRRALFLVPNERTKYKLKHHTVYKVQLVLLEHPGLRASSSCPLATCDETGLIFTQLFSWMWQNPMDRKLCEGISLAPGVSDQNGAVIHFRTTMVRHTLLGQ